MGCYTTILDPSQNLSVQIHTGEDNCDTFSVGDTIPWAPNPFTPGEHIDGVHEGLAGESGVYEDYFVVIKDCKVLAVVPKGPPAEFDDLDPAVVLYKQYGIKPPDPNLWTAEQWEERQRRHDEYKARSEEIRRQLGNRWKNGYYDRLAALLTTPIRDCRDYASLGRECFLVEMMDEK